MACTCQPGKGLCSSCLQTVYQRNAATVGTPLYAKPNGEYTLAQVEVFEEQFKSNIVEDIQNSPLLKAVKRYPDFYTALDQVNGSLRDSDLGGYDVLAKRMERGKLTGLEFADFLENSSYTPATAISSSQAQGPRFFNELNNYFNGSFANSILGGFCALFGSIFAAIDAFFDLVDAVEGLVQDVYAFIQKIKNIKDEVLAAFEAIKVKAIIEAIKEKISEMVKQVIESICASIANFNVEAITGPIPNPTPAQVLVAQRAEETKGELENICGPENAEKIKRKIQALIDYAVNLFANPSIEEITALIARICGLAAGIEGLFGKLKDPLNDFSNRYNEVFNTLSNASNRVTGEAIRAGAIRPTEEQRQRVINRARQLWEDAGNPPPIAQEELAGVPTWMQIKNNTHDKIRIQGGWVTNMVPPHEGWTRLNPQVKVMMMRLQREAKNEGYIPSYLILNSGFRSVQYNEDLRSRGIGAAKNSQHLQGNACDLTWPGFNPRSENLELFVSLAQRIGFRGVGYYNSFVHLDIGATRSWDRRS